jgi:hypothetical protein
MPPVLNDQCRSFTDEHIVFDDQYHGHRTRPVVTISAPSFGALSAGIAIVGALPAGSAKNCLIPQAMNISSSTTNTPDELSGGAIGTSPRLPAVKPSLYVNY